MHYSMRFILVSTLTQELRVSSMDGVVGQWETLYGIMAPTVEPWFTTDRGVIDKSEHSTLRQ